MRIGIIGVGTVGSGTVEIIESLSPTWAAEHGINVDIVALCARTASELEPFANRGYKLCTQVGDLLNDPSISVIVELAGGYEAPREWVLQALNQGKHVVTANKALIAKYGHEIFPKAAATGSHFLFEAAVGGGIPIIRSLQESLIGNRILSLSCIINGTCNYILSRMSHSGLSFAQALAEAQAKGYAEADPTFDVEGIDSAHKLAILASLCARQFVDFQKMSISGISSISADDIANAAELECTIKLLGIFRQVGERIDARVHPCLVSKEHLLSSVNGPMNAVFLECDHLGPTIQTGAGAGKLPTASAVAADLVSLARSLQGNTRPLPMSWFNTQNQATLLPLELLESRYYFRFTTHDACGVLAQITGVLAKNGISIESLIQKSVKDPGAVSIIAVCEKTTEARVVAALQTIDKLPEVVKPTRMIRFLD